MHYFHHPSPLLPLPLLFSLPYLLHPQHSHRKSHGEEALPSRVWFHAEIWPPKGQNWSSFFPLPPMCSPTNPQKPLSKIRVKFSLFWGKQKEFGKCLFKKCHWKRKLRNLFNSFFNFMSSYSDELNWIDPAGEICKSEMRIMIVSTRRDSDTGLSPTSRSPGYLIARRRMFREEEWPSNTDNWEKDYAL